MAEVLQQVSDALAATVEAASPGVVQVEARRRLPATGIVWSAEGLIITAHHVVEQHDALHVGLPQGQRVKATLVGRDPTTDLALLRVQATSLTPPRWAEPEGQEGRVGHLVLALGCPGPTVQATLGIVSALGGRWRTPAGGQMDRYVQTDVVMYPGFSGGPLVNVSGEVMGMNTSALLRHISLTVPATTLHRVVALLLAHGRVRRGVLGLKTQPVRLPEALVQQLGQATGLLLIAVEASSPADQAGLLLGDTLVTFDGAAIRQPDDLLAQLTPERIGQSVSIRIIRSGQVQDLQVVVGEGP
jgi:S1-C subfamily serine protease